MPPLKNLIGQKFGRLMAIKFAGLYLNGCALWLCQCDCGNKTIVLSNNLLRGNTKSCGCIHKNISSKMCKARVNQNNPNYINGRTKAIPELKEKIRRQANYKCQECSKSQEKIGRKLEVHHIDGDDTNNAEENLKALCTGCHNKTKIKKRIRGGTKC